jgi:transposase
MTYLRDLIHRFRCGESQRQVARDLGLARKTVQKYHQWAQSQGYLAPGCAFPDDAALSAALGEAPEPPKTESSVEPHRERVQELLAQGVEMTAIFARLRDDHGFTGSYSAIRRYVAHLVSPDPKVVVRVHSAPGEEAQVDFGAVGELFDPRSNRVRTAYVFVATLCYSRHQYAELVFDQKVPTWIALHRRVFETWGGVPRRIVPDNLKAAVIRALIDEPVLGEAYRRMALHYGFLVSPTRPGTPQHKGKIENGVYYVQRNFMAGQDFTDIDVANPRLRTWVQEIAGARIHGTTHQPPWRMFVEQERAALLPLPTQPFTLCEVRPVKVHPDCHVTLDGSYYSVPYAYVPGGALDKGQPLAAHVSERLVEIYDGLKLVSTHPRASAAGQWHTRLEHYPREKALYLERTPQRCRQLAAEVGSATGQVVERLLGQRPLDRLRAVQAILRLRESVSDTRLEAACARALHFGDASYRRIKTILDAALDREPLPETAAATPRKTFVFARCANEFFQDADEEERSC